jgi:hypothetical protein
MIVENNFRLNANETTVATSAIGCSAKSPSRGRTIQKKRILGTVEELPDVLTSLHGVTVDRIVVAIAPDRLPGRAMEILLDIEQSSDIAVHFLSEMLGRTRLPRRADVPSPRIRRHWRSSRTITAVLCTASGASTVI